MTVAELIEELRHYDPETIVLVYNPGIEDTWEACDVSPTTYWVGHETSAPAVAIRA